MRTNLFTGAILTVVVLCGSFAVSAKDKKRTNISMERAQQIALKRAPGTVEESNLVKRGGKERYSIFIRRTNGNMAHELISARSGHVLWLRDETPDKAKIR